MNKTRIQLFQKFYKMEEPLARLTIQNKENNLISRTRKEMGGITTDFTEFY